MPFWRFLHSLCRVNLMFPYFVNSARACSRSLTRAGWLAVEFPTKQYVSDSICGCVWVEISTPAFAEPMKKAERRLDLAICLSMSLTSERLLLLLLGGSCCYCSHNLCLIGLNQTWLEGSCLQQEHYWQLQESFLRMVQMISPQSTWCPLQHLSCIWRERDWWMQLRLLAGIHATGTQHAWARLVLKELLSSPKILRFWLLSSLWILNNLPILCLFRDLAQRLFILF